MERPLLLLLCLSCVPLGLLIGCASAPRADAPPESVSPAAASRPVPDDFALGLTVTNPSTRTVADHPNPRWARQARYVLEADSVLRVMRGPGTTRDTFPPFTRRLSREQVESIWRIVEDIPTQPTIEPASSLLPGSPQRATAGPSYDLELAAHGRRSRHTFTQTDPDEAGAAQARLLADRLAELAWLRD